MSKIIAAGTIVENEDLIVVGSVAEEVESTEESGSGSGAGSYYATINVKQYNADDFPADSITFDDIAEMVMEAGGSMAVPSIDGESTVALDAPVAVKYSKTKTFESDKGICVFVSYRYEF